MSDRAHQERQAGTLSGYIINVRHSTPRKSGYMIINVRQDTQEMSGQDLHQGTSETSDKGVHHNRQTGTCNKAYHGSNGRQQNGCSN